MDRRNTTGNLFTAVVLALGLSVLTTQLLQWTPKNLAVFYGYLLLALVTSGLKLNLPAVAGSISVNFVFVLLGIVDLSLAETLLIGCTATFLHSGFHVSPDRTRIPALFHVPNTALAIATAYNVYHWSWLSPDRLSPFLTLMLTASVLYGMNTFPLAAYQAFATRRSLGEAWKECESKTFPYYCSGAAVAMLLKGGTQVLRWESLLLIVPAIYFSWRYYRLFRGRQADERASGQAVTVLHSRTLETLAMAIEAKAQAGDRSLRRLEAYCTTIGRKMGMNAEELQALRTAALLHDLGKLAVPEHILAKPGRLSREEFEKVKIHSSVGAEIVERIGFPSPVAPIVRFHHEKWAGGGYPCDLKGEQIPLGARILGAVECMVALTSDRPYRQSLSVDEAIARIQAESGRSFDPSVVDLMMQYYLELEAIARTPEKTAVRQEPVTGVAPPAVAQEPGKAADRLTTDAEGFLEPIAAARREAQFLIELTQELGNSLSLNETISAAAGRLKRMVGFDTLALYVVSGESLVPHYATGEGRSLLLGKDFKAGSGLLGCVVTNKKPVLNADLWEELVAGGQTPRGTPLRSVLAVPLQSLEGVIGVMTLCRTRRGAFSRDDLRILQAVSAKLGPVVENAVKYERMTTSASTDHLTGLPNARSLFLHLDNEVSRCRRLGGSLTVLLCDLDGFKTVNDRFGHLEGNNMLRAVGNALREYCREYDYVARMGGDEFVVVLPSMRIEDVTAKVTQLSQIVSDASQQVCPDAAVSLSVGLARYPEDGKDAEQLLAEADQRMYKDKQHRKLSKRAPRGFDFDPMRVSTIQ